jgi:hypothetical protein
VVGTVKLTGTPFTPLPNSLLFLVISNGYATFGKRVSRYRNGTDKI